MPYPYKVLLEDEDYLLLEDSANLLLEWVELPSLTWLNVYDTTGALKSRILEYARIDECSVRSNTFGVLRFLIHQDAQGRDQIQSGRWIEVYRQTASGGDTVWSGIICYVKKHFDEAGNPTRFYEVTARSFEWLP